MVPAKPLTPIRSGRRLRLAAGLQVPVPDQPGRTVPLPVRMPQPPARAPVRLAGIEERRERQLPGVCDRGTTARVGAALGGLQLPVDVDEPEDGLAPERVLVEGERRARVGMRERLREAELVARRVGAGAGLGLA